MAPPQRPRVGRGTAAGARRARRPRGVLDGRLPVGERPGGAHRRRGRPRRRRRAARRSSSAQYELAEPEGALVEKGRAQGGGATSRSRTPRAGSPPRCTAAPGRRRSRAASSTYVLRDRDDPRTPASSARHRRGGRSSRAGSTTSVPTMRGGSRARRSRACRATRSCARSRRTSSGRCATSSTRARPATRVGPNMMTRNSYALNRPSSPSARR